MKIYKSQYNLIKYGSYTAGDYRSSTQILRLLSLLFYHYSLEG